MNNTDKVSLAALSALSIIGAVVSGALHIPELATALIGLAGMGIGGLSGIAVQSKLRTEQ